MINLNSLCKLHNTFILEVNQLGTNLEKTMQLSEKFLRNFENGGSGDLSEHFLDKTNEYMTNLNEIMTFVRKLNSHMNLKSVYKLYQREATEIPIKSGENGVSVDGQQKGLDAGLKLKTDLSQAIIQGFQSFAITEANAINLSGDPTGGVMNSGNLMPMTISEISPVTGKRADVLETGNNVTGRSLYHDYPEPRLADNELDPPDKVIPFFAAEAAIGTYDSVNVGMKMKDCKLDIFTTLPKFCDPFRLTESSKNYPKDHKQNHLEFYDESKSNSQLREIETAKNSGNEHNDYFSIQPKKPDDGSDINSMPSQSRSSCLKPESCKIYLKNADHKSDESSLSKSFNQCVSRTSKNSANNRESVYTEQKIPKDVLGVHTIQFKKQNPIFAKESDKNVPKDSKQLYRVFESITQFWDTETEKNYENEPKSGVYIKPRITKDSGLPSKTNISSSNKDVNSNDSKMELRSFDNQFIYTTKNYAKGAIITITPTCTTTSGRFFAIVKDENNPVMPFMLSTLAVPRESILTTAPKVSQILLAKYKDGIWYRAQVIETNVMGNLSKIFYIDYGFEDFIHFCNLAYCEKEVAFSPALALLCQLANDSPGISSIQNTTNTNFFENTWTAEVISHNAVLLLRVLHNLDS